MFERLCQSDMTMFKSGYLLFKKVENYEATTVLLTGTMKDLVQRTAPLFQPVMMTRRSPKPNPKYNPEEFDLSYVGVRRGSRRSIRRAER